jgi:hypothetical protein
VPSRPPERLLDRTVVRRGKRRIGPEGYGLNVYRRHRLDPIEFHLSPRVGCHAIVIPDDILPKRRPKPALTLQF